MGTTLTGNVTDHINIIIQAARRAYYGLESSGVCCDGVTPETLSHIYKVGIQPILTYGCSAVNIDHKSVKCMDRVQGMLIKTALGLPKNRRNSPLLAALGIEKIEQLIKRQQLSLLRNSLISNSKARTFYIGMMRAHHKGNKNVSLLSGVKQYVTLKNFHYKHISLMINMKSNVK